MVAVLLFTFLFVEIIGNVDLSPTLSNGEGGVAQILMNSEFLIFTFLFVEIIGNVGV